MAGWVKALPTESGNHLSHPHDSLVKKRENQLTSIHNPWNICPHMYMKNVIKLFKQTYIIDLANKEKTKYIILDGCLSFNNTWMATVITHITSTLH